MVFQNYALYPHMTVRQNLGFGLKLRRTPRDDIRARVDEVARTLELDNLMDRKPAALSGGQRQRVAMGRAMVRQPLAFLMDEPLSNLDAKLRVQMRAELARLHDRLGTTTVYVTHDQVEAMTLGSRVAVMKDGVLQQVDTPQTLFNRPANLFVAAFIGSPPMNLVEAGVAKGEVSFAGLRFPLAPGSGLEEREGSTVILGIRPSDLEDATVWKDASLPTMEVVADVTEELGSEINVLFPVDAPPVTAELALAAVTAESEEGDLVPLGDEEGRAIFCARVDARSPVRPGARVRLTCDPSRFHFFDPATGEAVGSRRPIATGAAV
jgi:multiple sugar transport system ATP-binding protein